MINNSSTQLSYNYYYVLYNSNSTYHLKCTPIMITSERVACQTQDTNGKLLELWMVISISLPPFCWRFPTNFPNGHWITKELPLILEIFHLNINQSQCIRILHHPLYTCNQTLFNFEINFKIRSIMQFRVKIIGSNMQWPLELVVLS